MKITYVDKKNAVPVVDEQKQVTAGNLNMIKHVVNKWIDDVAEIKRMVGAGEISLDEFKEVVAYIRANRDDLEQLSVENIAGLQDWMDRLEVGCRNYILQTNVIIANYKELSFSFEDDLQKLEGKDVILSIDIEVEGATEGHIGYECVLEYADGNTEYLSCFKYPNGEFKGRISNVFRIKDKPIKNVRGYMLVQCDGSKHLCSYPALYLGNNNKSWSPAPEDLQFKGDSFAITEKRLKTVPVDGLFERDTQGNLYFTNGSTRKKIKLED